MILNLKKYSIHTVVTLLSIFLVGCNKNYIDPLVSDTSKDAMVTVNLKGITFETPYLDNNKQGLNKFQSSTLGISKLASTTPFPMNNGIGYLVVAFDKVSKRYAGEAFFIAGRESETEFKLSQGKEYIFYAFSYNIPGSEVVSGQETKFMPNLLFGDDDILDDSYIDGVKSKGNQVSTSPNIFSTFYAARIDNLPALTENNQLDIVLKQQHATLNIEFDYTEIHPTDTVSASTYTVSSPQVLKSANALAFSLGSNQIINTGASSSVDYYDFWNSKTYDAHFFLEAPEVVTDLTFSDVKIQGVPTNKSLVVKDVVLKAGAKYKLIVKFKPGAGLSLNTSLEYIDAGNHDETITLPSF